MGSQNLLSLLLLLLSAQGALGIITAIRLMNYTVDSTTMGYGRVEVFSNGSWTSVCDDFWSTNEAETTCRMRGFTTGPFTPIRNQVPHGASNPLVLKINCTSTFSSLNSCIQTSIVDGECGDEAAAVQCVPLGSTTAPPVTAAPTPSPSNIPGVCPPYLRLVANPGAYFGTGIVEVQHPTTGVWGTICDDLWDVMDATVVCRMCNYHLSQWWYPRPGAQGSDIFGASSLAIHLDDVECVGSELDVRNCPHRNWNEHNCNANEKASVSCIQFNSSAKPPPSPGIDCSNDMMLVSFSRVYDPNLLPRHLTVNPPSGCASAVTSVNSTHVNVFIPIRNCNMILKQNETHIVYQNVIRYDYTNVTGFITYVNEYDIYVSCEMNRTANLTRIYTPLREVANVSAAGAYNFTMLFFLNDSFSDPDPRLPLPIAIGEKLNVGIRLEGNHNNLEVIVHNCWTTPVPPSVSTVSQNLMINNCRVEPTLRTFPLNHTMFGFRFQTYKFTTSNLIYVNCDAFACIRFLNISDCDQTCSNPKPTPTYPITVTGFGRRKRDTSSSPQRYLLTSPPVYVYEPGLEGDLSAYVQPATPEVKITTPAATTPHKQEDVFAAAALENSAELAQAQTLVLQPYKDAAMVTRATTPVLLCLLAVLVVILMP